MAITMESIKTLRAMTGAGLADVKKALTEADGDMDRAKEILRERGQAIAAKRSDRETSNGCVLVKNVDGFAAMIALKCETDFVANGADFIALTQNRRHKFALFKIPVCFDACIPYHFPQPLFFISYYVFV